MKIFSLTALCTCLVASSHIAIADETQFETKDVDQLTATSPDGTATLSVSLERIDRDKIRQVSTGKETPPEAWLGKRKLPSGILWRNNTLISSFSLKLDGKKITIPERFWNDLPGLNLRAVVINKKPATVREEQELEDLTNSLWTPKVSRSRDGSTVLISWIRPEE